MLCVRRAAALHPGAATSAAGAALHASSEGAEALLAAGAGGDHAQNVEAHSLGQGPAAGARRGREAKGKGRAEVSRRVGQQVQGWAAAR